MLEHATTGWNEADRLAALRRYGILDAPVEQAFADFVRIAAEVCEAPIAVVNLIDEARQWFAAERGLGVRQTPLDISICAQAILQPGVFVVPDLALDSRFGCNPLVTGPPGLRFYGGALLRTAEGLPIGTMCVLDTVPRPAGLTARQRFTLEALARQVMAQLDLRLALAEREAAVAAQAALLAEKDLLMQEVHHRVKNSLAMVQALLRVQARGVADPAVAAPLRESAGRIGTIAAMHEQLYQVGAGSHVEVAAYLAGLLKTQHAAMALADPGRRIRFAGAPAAWPASEAPALGLIAIELVTNALKYGAGDVAVGLAIAGPEAELRVEDAGTGLPAEFDPAAATGFGLRVVNGLLRVRHGVLEVDRTRPSTCFVARLRVPEMPYAVA